MQHTYTGIFKYTFFDFLPENIISLTLTSTSLSKKFIHFIESALIYLFVTSILYFVYGVTYFGIYKQSFSRKAIQWRQQTTMH